MLTVDEIKAQNKASYFKAEMRGKNTKITRETYIL